MASRAIKKQSGTTRRRVIMSDSRPSIIHGDIVDAIIESGHRIDDGGGCAGLTMKWLASTFLGEEDERVYDKRLFFITKYHKRWNLYRQRNEYGKYTYDGYAVVLIGSPATWACFYKNNILIKSIDLTTAKKYRQIKRIDRDLFEFIRSSKNGKISIDTKFLYSEKDVIKELLRDANLTYSELIYNIKKARNKVKRKGKLNVTEEKFITIPPFFDGVVLFQEPEILDSKLSQSQINQIEQYAASQKAEANHGDKMLNLIYSRPRIFNFVKLDAYLTDLEQLSDLENDQLRMSFGSINHRIGLRYHQKNNTWTFMNANELPPFKIDRSQLTRSIMAALDELDITAFRFNVYSTKGYIYQKSSQSQLINLEKKYPINDDELCGKVTSNHSTLLFIAAGAGDSQIVPLLEKYINLDLKTLAGNSILHLAAENGHADFIEALLKAKPSLNLNDLNVVTKNHAIHYATIHGHLNVIELLLNHNISLHVIDNNGDTPLHLAVKCGHSEIVEFLLEKSYVIDIHKPNNKNDTVLFIAFENEDIDIIELILNKHKKIENTLINHILKMKNLKNKMATFLLDRYSQSIIQQAIKVNANVKVIKNLLYAIGKSTVNAKRDSHGNTLLHLSAEYGNVSAIELFLKKGGDATLLNMENKTPLDIAIDKNHVQAVELLLHYMQKNWTSDELQNKIKSILHDMSIQDSTNSQWLDVNSVDENIHVLAGAIRDGHITYAINLLRMGIDIHKQHNNSETILQLILAHYHPDIIDTLMQMKVQFTQNIEVAVDVAINNDNEKFLLYLFDQINIPTYFGAHPTDIVHLFKRNMLNPLKIIHQQGYDLFLSHQDYLLALDFNTLCELVIISKRKIAKHILGAFLNQYLMQHHDQLATIRNTLVKLQTSNIEIADIFINELSIVNRLDLFSLAANDFHIGTRLFANTLQFNILSDYFKWRISTCADLIQFVSSLIHIGHDQKKLCLLLMQGNGQHKIKSMLMEETDITNINSILNYFNELHFSLDDLVHFFRQLDLSHFIDVIKRITTHEQPNKTFVNLMHFAAYHGDITLFAALIKMGVDINCQNAQGKTPLHIAAETKNIELLELLITANADFTISDHERTKPIDILIQNDLLDIVIDHTKLIQSIISDQCAYVLLNKSAQRGDLNMVCLCLDQIGLHHVTVDECKDEGIRHYLDMHNIIVNLHREQSGSMEHDLMESIKTIQLTIHFLIHSGNKNVFLDLCDNLLNVYSEYRKLEKNITPQRMACLHVLILQVCYKCCSYMKNHDSTRCQTDLLHQARRIRDDVSDNHKKQGALSFTTFIPLRFFQDQKEPGGVISSRLATIIQDAIHQSIEHRKYQQALMLRYL